MPAERETRCAHFRLRAEGYVHATYVEDAVVELEDAREGVVAAWQVAGERRTGLLVDLRGIRAQSREAREYFVTNEVSAMIASVALLVGSPLSRMVGNFFMRLNRHPIPTRLFTEQKEAEQWLVGGSRMAGTGSGE